MVEKTSRKVASLASQLEAAKAQLVEDESAHAEAREEVDRTFAALQSAHAAKLEEDTAALEKQKAEKPKEAEGKSQRGFYRGRTQREAPQTCGRRA